MLIVVIALVLFAALGILGAVVKGLLWLSLIAVVLIGVTVAYGWRKFGGSRTG